MEETKIYEGKQSQLLIIYKKLRKQLQDVQLEQKETILGKSETFSNRIQNQKLL